MPVIFAVTLFVSASLLFMVQPMVGRMVLPLLGGSPAAWNTCMVFFQIVLLLGYFYAHKLTEKLSTRGQILLHITVLMGAIATFAIAATLSYNHSPIAIIKHLAPQSTAYPMFGVLMLLFVAIGIPFFAISTSAPLLQRWFAYTGHPSSKDPYFLYAASNAGSLLSLLAYPLILEPSLSLVGQAWLFAVGFVVLTSMVFFCSTLIGTSQWKNQGKKAAAAPAPEVPAGPPPTLGRKIHWTALAFVPSSLMLGVTFHMTTDIASIPLLWVGPLALYLLTFIIAFARVPRWVRPVLGNVSPVLTLLLIFVLFSNTPLSVFFSLGLHLAVYYFTALMCHTELAHDRPSPAYLTNFYLWISLGGMLGGIFNALVAPICFKYSYEYLIAIAIGCMLIPKLTTAKEEEASKEKAAFQNMLDFVIGLGMFAFMAMLTLLPEYSWVQEAIHWVARNMSAGFQFCRLPIILDPSSIRMLLVFALPCMICFLFIERPIRFGLCVAAILAVGTYRQHQNHILATDRSFFGILKVEGYEGDNYRRLVHGTTLHGTQAIENNYSVYDFLEPLGAPTQWDALLLYGAFEKWNFREEPLTYYHRTGPVGQMFVNMRDRNPTAPFAMVGLGTGSVSCYALPGQSLTFYEIDPTVKQLVADTDKYFTFYTDAVKRGANMKIVLGDARLKLEENNDKYELLLVDAFSSDSIPVHLLTKEAVELYLNHLSETGILALHISNKYVSLDYVVAKIAEELGLTSLVFNDSWYDSGDSAQSYPPGKTQSSWVVLSRNPALLEPFKTDRFTTTYNYKYVNEKPDVHRWHPLEVHPSVRLWTDDYADVMSVMMIKEIQKIRYFLGMPTIEKLRK